jgi:hypothetical protein
MTTAEPFAAASRANAWMVAFACTSTSWARLIQEQHLGLHPEPFREHDLLLIPARQGREDGVGSGRPDVQPVDPSVDLLALGGPAERTAAPRVSPQVRDRAVLADRQVG